MFVNSFVLLQSDNDQPVGLLKAYTGRAKAAQIEQVTHATLVTES